MSYSSVRGLGYTMTIDTPIGPQKVTVPIEKAASDAADLAMGVIKKKAIPLAEQAIPGMLKSAMPTIQKEVLPPLFKAAEAELTTKIWPEFQPKIRAEIDYAMGKATTLGLLVGGIVAGSIALSTWYLRGQIRKGRAA
jgi:hypothetical protein